MGYICLCGSFFLAANICVPSIRFPTRVLLAHSHLCTIICTFDSGKTRQVLETLRYLAVFGASGFIVVFSLHSCVVC